jgi:hypothetical protein
MSESVTSSRPLTWDPGDAACQTARLFWQGLQTPVGEHVFPCLSTGIDWIEISPNGLMHISGRSAVVDRLYMRFMNRIDEMRILHRSTAASATTVTSFIISSVDGRAETETFAAIMRVVKAEIRSTVVIYRPSIELLGRLNSHPRSAHLQLRDKKSLILNLQWLELSYEGKCVILSDSQAKILAALFTSPGSRIAVPDLSQLLWNEVTHNAVGRIDVHLTNIRAKLLSVTGVGKLVRSRAGYIEFVADSLKDVNAVVEDASVI